MSPHEWDDNTVALRIGSPDGDLPRDQALGLLFDQLCAGRTPLDLAGIDAEFRVYLPADGRVPNNPHSRAWRARLIVALVARVRTETDAETGKRLAGALMEWVTDSRWRFSHAGRLTSDKRTEQRGNRSRGRLRGQQIQKAVAPVQKTIVELYKEYRERNPGSSQHSAAVWISDELTRRYPKDKTTHRKASGVRAVLRAKDLR